MSEKIVQLNEDVIKGQLKELVRGSVEETLNELLEAEAEKLTQAARCERNEQRQATVAATTTATSPPLPEMSLSLYQYQQYYQDFGLKSSLTYSYKTVRLEMLWIIIYP